MIIIIIIIKSSQNFCTRIKISQFKAKFMIKSNFFTNHRKYNDPILLNIKNNPHFRGLLINSLYIFF